MAIVKMKKATILALQSEKESIIKNLHSFGNFQIDNLQEQVLSGDISDLVSDSDSERVNQLEAQLSKVKYLLDFINRYDKTKKSMFASKPLIEESKWNNYLDDEKVDKVYGVCKSIDEKLVELKNAETKANNFMLQLEPWIQLDIPIEDLKNTSSTSIAIGSIPIKYSEDFKIEITTSCEASFVQIVSQNKEYAYVLIIYHNDFEEKISQIQKQFGWTRTQLGEYEGTVSSNMTKAKGTLEGINKSREALSLEAARTVEYREFMEAVYDILTVERDKAFIINSFVKTESTFMIQGWLPESSVDSLKKSLNAVTDAYNLELADPAEDEDIPVLLDNPKLVQPLEMITEQYSLPNPRSIDPNVIMTPFYVMFFGMMVSDAGYGIILAIMTALALFKLDLEGGAKKLVGLLCLGGISTFLWGALFGGWFGESLFAPIWFNPLEDPLKMLIFCLLLGVLQLYVGMAMQAYKSIRSGNYLDALFDQGFWYLFLTGLMFLALPPVAQIGKYMAIGGAIGLVLTQGRSEKNIFKKLISGVLSLYNVTAFLGDVLSYSRLFALGLATGVIGAVVNSMSLMLGGSILGNILMIAFLVLGHTFNIAINVLGAYVHASRLQYVEFFGKFFEGDGKPFTPFRVRSKFVKIKL